MANKINLQHFNSLIDNIHIAEFFEQIENHVLPQHRTILNELKNEFLMGKATAHFYQRLKTFLTLFLQKPKVLHVLVLACDKMQLTNHLQEIKKESKDKKDKKVLDNFEQQEVHVRYGNSPSDWKPYNDETIQELLDIFKQQFDVEILYQFISFNDDKQAKNYKLEINGKEENIVLIGDIWALHPITQKHNRKVAKSFDHKKTGGCIIPICEKLDSGLQKVMKEITQNIFDDILCQCFYDYFTNGKYEDLGFLHIDLEVPNKHSLFRKLNHILNFNAPKISNNFPEFKTIEEPKINL